MTSRGKGKIPKKNSVESSCEKNQPRAANASKTPKTGKVLLLHLCQSMGGRKKK